MSNEMQQTPTKANENEANGQNEDSEETVQDIAENPGSVTSGKTVESKTKPPGKKSPAELKSLKKKLTSSLSALTKKRNEISKLMFNEENLHLVKTALEELNSAFLNYQSCYSSYYEKLTSEEDQDYESNRYSEKEISIHEFRKQVRDWISQTEHYLSEHLDSVSHAKSSHGSKRTRASSSSTKSARMKEKARLAELMAEKAMIKERQALQSLQLDIEIAKTQAREQVFAELESKIENPRSEAANTSEYQYSLASKHEDSKFKLGHEADKKSEVGTNHQQPLNPLAPEFTANTKPASSTPNPIQLQKNEEFPHYHHNQSLQVQKQIASAMLLPQPDVPKFRGDPIEYNKFIMAFDTRIIAHTSGETDCLYYLDQLLEGEAKDLIGGCLFMDPINGYHEARKLLEKEYGDPFKISTAYINKVLTWPIIKQEDSLGLKRLALFLVKCESAMSSIFHMSVLNHAPNMQAIVQKLPFYLQNK